jgi:hypothetical protein
VLNLPFLMEVGDFFFSKFFSFKFRIHLEPSYPPLGF